jgi:hypothetical protein
MKSLILMMAIVLFSNLGVFAQAQKNMVKSYPFSGAKTITLAVDGPVEVEEWDEKIVRLVTTIDAVNFNEGTLKALTEAGRYACDYKDHFTEGMVLTMLKAQKELVIRGVKIEEKYSFKIFVPRGTLVEQVKHEEVVELF